MYSDTWRLVDAIAPLPAPVMAAIRTGRSDTLPAGGLLDRIWRKAVEARQAWAEIIDQSDLGFDYSVDLELPA